MIDYGEFILPFFMIGKLDVEEDVMDDDLPRARKAAAVMKTVSGNLSDVIATLGWDCYDDVVVEVGGTVVSGIHQGDDYNKKWATPYGVRKYNKDAFIVIKNLSRTPFEPSEPNSELIGHHVKENGPGDQGHNDSDSIGQPESTT